MQIKVICETPFGRIVRERDGGLVRVDPPRTAAQLGALHATEEYFNHPYFLARRKIDSGKLKEKHVELLRRVFGGMPAAGARLLDVGCDTGVFLRAGREEFGLDVAGIDVSEHAARAAKEVNDVDVTVGNVQDLPPPVKKFDAATMIDVVEHLADPESFVRALAGWLKPDGRLYIVTPNHDALIFMAGGLLYRLFGRRAAFLLDKLYIPYHEFYFTAHTLSALLTRAGYKIVSVRTSEFPLDEFGHGAFLKVLLAPLFLLQFLTRRQSLLEIAAIRKECK